MQTDWDRVDPITTAGGAAVPRTPSKQLLLMEARGDSQVANVATEIEALTMGLPVLAPAVAVPWGMTAQAGPLTRALAIYDEHLLPTPPLTNTSLRRG